MPENTDQFSAVDPAIGYLYQIRCALLWSLQRLKEEATFEASIEILDDVAFESAGLPIELLQTKHHKHRGANLTDASPDLWKTIRIWIAAKDAGEITDETMLYLVTTENAASGTISAYLKSNERRIEDALQGMEAVAQSSTNQANAAAYEAFLRKSHTERRVLVEQIIIIDAAPDIDDLKKLLCEEVFHAVDRSSLETFLSYLEGWWFGRAVTQLRNVDTRNRILSDELEAQMADLRDRFKSDSLPISDDLLNYELQDETVEVLHSFPFVHQVELATSNKTRITAAIRDYYRAFEQRSRWQRQDLLFVGDLTIYEKTLIEEWELIFADMEDRVGEEAAEETKKMAALDVLRWAEMGSVNARIKPGVTDSFITRGSLHILANELKIGWHPEFKKRLQYLLEGEIH